MTPVNHDVRVAALVDELAALETRLDPETHGRDRRVADLITVAMLLPLVVGFDWHANRPLLMLAAMVGGLVLNRIPQWITRWRLRREQERVFDEYARVLSLAQSVRDEETLSAEDDESSPPGGTA